jgi:hypothetical protein
MEPRGAFVAPLGAVAARDATGAPQCWQNLSPALICIPQFKHFINTLSNASTRPEFHPGRSK